MNFIIKKIYYNHIFVDEIFFQPLQQEHNTHLWIKVISIAPSGLDSSFPKQNSISSINEKKLKLNSNGKK